jgi:hypothetical protein
MHISLLEAGGQEQHQWFRPSILAPPVLTFLALLRRRPPQAFGTLAKFTASRAAASLVSRLAAGTRLFFEIEIGEQMVTALILILGGVLLAALAVIYFSVVRRRQRRK